MQSNQVIVTGNLGANPEHHKKNEESAGVITFSLAENVSKFNETTKQYEHTHTNWFPIRSFGSLGLRAKSSLKKGDCVTVIGKMKTFKYQMETGIQVSAFEVFADDIVKTGFLPKSASQAQTESQVTDETPDFGEF